MAGDSVHLSFPETFCECLSVLFGMRPTRLPAVDTATNVTADARFVR